MKPMTFNLLPQNNRSRMRDALYIVILRNGVALLATAFVLVASLLFIGNSWLHRSADSEEGTVAALVSRTQPGNATTLAADIKAFNDSLLPIDQLQSGYIKWSVVLEQFFSTVPEHIVLDAFTVQRSTTTITVSGTAATRDDFQTMQKAFTESKTFMGTTLPTPDLLERADIPFTLTTHFTP